MNKEFEKQISLFDGSAPFKIDKPIRLIELFAGIGAQAKALERLQDEGLCTFEHYRICEFDRFAVASYNAIHGTDFQTSDITQIKGEDLGITETDKYCYIMTYSFPCTDLSLAGKQEGMAKGSGTRSGLLWEVERLLNEIDELPQVLLMENVPQVICEDFFEWCRFLENKGYKNYYKLMNSKNYGVPQNRNRCFMVSLLGDYLYEFPAPFPLKKRLKDVLEDKVDEKYYISDKAVKYIEKRLGKYTQLINDESETAESAITSKGNQNWTGNFVEEGIIVKGNYSPSGHDASRIVDTEGLAPTVKENHGTVTAITEDVSKTIRGGGSSEYRPSQLGHHCGGLFKRHGKEFVGTTDIATTLYARDYKGMSNRDLSNGVIECQQVGELQGGIYDTYEQIRRVYGTDGLSPTIDTMLGGGKGVKILDEQNGYIREDGTVGTITTDGSSPKHDNRVIEDTSNLRIRKLTPKECFRLMDFDDADFEKASKVNSDSQLYKQAGNSIVVNCLYLIFKEMM